MLKDILYSKEVEAMEISKIALDEIFERLKADALEECREKAETEYLLQQCKTDISDEER